MDVRVDPGGDVDVRVEPGGTNCDEEVGVGAGVVAVYVLSSSTTSIAVPLVPAFALSVTVVVVLLGIPDVDDDDVFMAVNRQTAPWRAIKGPHPRLELRPKETFGVKNAATPYILKRRFNLVINITNALVADRGLGFGLIR